MAYEFAFLNQYFFAALQKWEMLHNNLKELPEDIGQLRKLECLYVQHNDIEALPIFEGCDQLQELHISNNFIKVSMK